MSTDSVNVNEVSINGVKYVRADSVPAAETPPTGKRAILVLDRGWIVVGDVDDANGRISVTRAAHIRSWSSIGFDGLVASVVMVWPLMRGLICLCILYKDVCLACSYSRS